MAFHPNVILTVKHGDGSIMSRDWGGSQNQIPDKIKIQIKYQTILASARRLK